MGRLLGFGCFHHLVVYTHHRLVRLFAVIKTVSCVILPVTSKHKGPLQNSSKQTKIHLHTIDLDPKLPQSVRCKIVHEHKQAESLVTINPDSLCCALSVTYQKHTSIHTLLLPQTYMSLLESEGSNC